MDGGWMRRVRPYETTVTGIWRKFEVYIRGLHDPHFYQMGPGNIPAYNDKVTVWTVRSLIPGTNKTLSLDKKCPDQLWPSHSLLFNGHLCLSPEVNLSGREFYHRTTPSVEVKNKCSYTSTPPSRLHGVDRDNFNSLLLPNLKLIRRWTVCIPRMKKFKETRP